MANASKKQHRSGGKRHQSRKEKRISYELQKIGLPPGALISVPGNEQTTIECFRYNPDGYQLTHKLPMLFDFVPTASLPRESFQKPHMGGDFARTPEGLGNGSNVSRSAADTAYGSGWSSQPLPNKDRFVHWINIDNPSPEVLTSLTELYGVHSLVLEDIQSPLPRPKFEEYTTNLYITIQVPIFTNGEPDRQTIAMICGTGYIISFLKKDSAILASLKSRIMNDQGRIRKLGADYLAFCILDESVDRSFPIIEIMESNIEDLEAEILSSADQRNLELVLATKREIRGLRHYIWPLTEVVAGLQRTHSSFITEEVRLYMRDIVDHGLHLSELVNGLRDMTLGLMDLYHSSSAGNLNKVIKVLTMISTIFIPLTFISSIYGMNFEFMPELKSPLGYPIVLGSMVALGIGMFIFFKRKKWL